MECTCVAVEPTAIDALIEMMRAYYAFDGLTFDEPKTRRAVGRLLADPRCGRAFFVRVGDAIAGYAVLVLGYSIEFHGRDAFVDEIFLREEYRGQGLGPRVLTFLEEVCRSLDVRALHLEVERHNVAAQRVYRRVGFVDHDRYLMTKRIEGNDQ